MTKLPSRRNIAEVMPADGRNFPAVNGFLNLYKPVGPTSMEALRRVKRITGQRKKVGHAGTLDPLAEGVLPVCFGQATRLMELVVSGWKKYRMTVRLGAVSNTYDAEGEITEVVDPAGLSRREIAAALLGFVGVIEQTPPMYSAVKVDGQRLYNLARAGREITRPPRQVRVRSISIDRIALPYLQLTVDCGRGAYLRSIAHDLGQALGCGGYVTQLARLSCGQFLAADGVTLEQLEDAAANGEWLDHLHPVDWALQDLPAIGVDADDAWAIRHGQAVWAAVGGDALDETGQRRAYDPDGVFLALVQRQSGMLWQPTRVFYGQARSPYAPVNP